MTYKESMIYIMAARYAHNRYTGAAFVAVSNILDKWDEFCDNTKEQIYSESFDATCNMEDWVRIQKKYEEEFDNSEKE